MLTASRKSKIDPRVWIWARRCALLILIITGGLFLRRPLLLENRTGLLLPVFAAFSVFLAIPWIRAKVFGRDHWVLTIVFVVVMSMLSSRTFQVWHDPSYVNELPRWVDMILLCGLYVVMARGFFFLLERAGEVIARRRAKPQQLIEAAQTGWLSFWAPFGATVVTVLAFLLYVYYPYGTSPDTTYQLGMLQGTLRLNDIHTPAHTILLSIFLHLTGDLFWNVIFQILLVSCINGLFGRLLVRRWQVPLKWVVLLSVVFGLGTYNYIYVYPWKDTPYMFCVGIVTYFCMRRLDDDFVPGIAKGIALGAALAFSYLFRYNGIILVTGCALMFIVWAIRGRYFRFLVSMLLAVAVSVAGVNICAYNIMGMERWDNGFALQVFASGIATVVVNDGNITEEELAQVDELMGIDWLCKKHIDWDTRQLIWGEYEEDPEGFFQEPSNKIYNNHMVVKMGGHAKEIVLLYLSLLPRNLGLMIRDVAQNTWVIWSFDGFFCHAFLAMILILAMLASWTKKTMRKRWTVFLPVALNTLSIIAATITNEKRYLLPTYAMFVPLLMYVLATADKRQVQQTDAQQIEAK